MSRLTVSGLRLQIGRHPILHGIDLDIAAGETLGLVGESGSGKSLTALSIMRLLPADARLSGHISLEGVDLAGAPEAAMNSLRGCDIAMVFQEPMSALNPVKPIGEQVAEGIRWHTGANRADAEERARRMLDRVGLPAGDFPLSRYPHELSGGQRQRVVIAMACALSPRLLLADEPTTALDVVLQAQILDLLRELVAENKMSLMLISHDLAIVAGMTDRVAIMREGRIVEQGPTARILTEQAHPYTRQLAEASSHVPARPQASESRQPAKMLEVKGLVRDYPGRRTSMLRRPVPVRAVDDVSFDMFEGEAVALVGRSGCGKSTLARAVLALDPVSSGSIRFGGRELVNADHATLRAARRDMQVVFQDPYGSFNPRHRVERLVAEPLHLLSEQPDATERREKVAQALLEVGLNAKDMDKYPHEFSGGQRQRLSIARALITRPRLIVADEPVSALDVSIRAQILDLFADLNMRLGCGFLFITHDLTVARAITSRVLVMHEGKIVESGATDEVLANPATKPARDLVDAAPDLAAAIALLREKITLQGAAISPG